MTTNNQNDRSTFDELRTVADEIRLKIHLASMEAKTYWEKLEPEVVKLERAVQEKGNEALDAARGAIDSVGQEVRKLRDQLLDHKSPH
jgi:hypothetical protein